jgi:hypothetical protein
MPRQNAVAWYLAAALVAGSFVVTERVAITVRRIALVASSARLSLLKKSLVGPSRLSLI